MQMQRTTATTPTTIPTRIVVIRGVFHLRPAGFIVFLRPVPSVGDAMHLATRRYIFEAITEIVLIQIPALACDILYF